MTPADLSRTVVRAVRCAVEGGELGAGAVVPERVVVERTRPGGVGEYATPVALQLAKASGRRPAEVADLLARRLGRVAGIRHVEITGPGFLNFSLSDDGDGDGDGAAGAGAGAREVVRLVRARGAAYGFADSADLPAPVDRPGTDAAADQDLRTRAVREAVGRLLRSQGVPDDARLLRVAPVARADGDVVRRYGADASRWGMLATDPAQPPHFGPVLLVQGEASEFFRVRYAVARARALVRNAAQLGFAPATDDPATDYPATDYPATDDPTPAGATPARTPTTKPLLDALREYPLVLEAAAHHRAPERLARHLVALADALLDFQYDVLPRGDEKPSAAHRSRLALADAAGTVLAGGLTLLGVDIPEVV
ncbi:ArgS-related anticodon-binding protein NrtL [Streptomyces sp. NPDC006529]|uniref:ArgS-related anticodon-binding protein NrtL n=1 Tax=Streptomyces sp. NPDC006529 TaxID=3157177 RepID=UPI0033BADA95